MDNSEYFDLSIELERHQTLFSMFWKAGVPIWDEKITTAGVVFNKKGKFLEFRFNPEFWKSLDQNTKVFVICHEMLHLFLEHGKRGDKYLTVPMTNIAMDVAVNHLLINNFGFSRSTIMNQQNYCWVDTVFPPEERIPDNKSFEFYFDLLKNENPDDFTLSLVDVHGLLDMDNENLQKMVNDSLSKMSKKELEEFKEEMQQIASHSTLAGTVAGGLCEQLDKMVVSPKKKWETVIKNWAKKYLSDTDKNVEQWCRINRRFHLIKHDMFLPTDMEEEQYEKKKIEVWFFQDTSGSCFGYTTRFFAAALSLPKTHFDVKMHCFDTEVYETSLESRKLYGFGGTSFSCIERYINNYMKSKNTDYPKAIFVITDGYGDSVNPSIPNRWHWFLTPGGSHYYCTGKVYDLQNFE